jgi:nucleoside-diphosphate-sugar epimerase
MRIVITGATGNLGTSLLAALEREGGVDSVVAIARRKPELLLDNVEWVAHDVADAPLDRLFVGADAVVHLAWQIQPSRDWKKLERTNVLGSRMVFAAAARAGAKAIIYASSVGAYSPAEDARQEVDESWPTRGIPSSAYSRQKARVEALLDQFERDFPGMRVVRMRPGLIFKREAGSEIKRYFAGPLLPRFLLRNHRIPFVPNVPELRFQAVHSLDVGEAFRLALLSDARGAFNVAAEPVLSMQRVAELLDAKPVRMPARALRALVSASYALHLQPTEPGWLDLALRSPLLRTRRVRTELGWWPRYSSTQALAELIEGMGQREGLPTPPLTPEQTSVTA